MTSPVQDAIARAFLELGRDTIRGELEELRDELQRSSIAQLVGYAHARVKDMRERRPDGKLSQEDIASLIDELPAVARAARAAEEQDDGAG